MSSDLLAYGASDGTLTVCSVSENPSVIKQLNGHSKDVTGWIDCLCFFVLYLILYDMYGHWLSALRQYHLMYYFFDGRLWINKSCSSYFQLEIKLARYKKKWSVIDQIFFLNLLLIHAYQDFLNSNAP